VQKISPPLVFDPQTILPVASHYIDWTVAAHLLVYRYQFVLEACCICLQGGWPALGYPEDGSRSALESW
jgi:hypothetical protein